MMEKSTIKKIILENQERIPDLTVVKRSYSVEPLANYIFTGQRRAGKTFFMYSLMQDMVKQGQSIEEILYINFEDERLIGMDVGDLDSIIESYRELFSHKHILFFDEIQNITGWQKFARRLADSGFQIYITGSNSEMLSNEMASTLGGRFMVMEIGTLSFKEYLNFNGVDISDNIGFSPDRFEVIRLFDKYFAEGGFPELLKFNEKKEYLSSIFQKVFLGDIIARYQLRNPQALRLLIKKLAESTMDVVSYSRMRNIIVSAGFPVGTNTVIEYINFLENSFLINTLLNSNAKISIRESKKKYYFRDNGILSLFLIEPASFELETLVFNHLRLNYGSNLFYFRNGFEVDFFVPGEELIQVCYSLEEPATRKREISSLYKVYDKNPVKRLTIVTYSTEEIINENGMEIKVMPAWRWLLES
jgi:hypothetical protein